MSRTVARLSPIAPSATGRNGMLAAARAMVSSCELVVLVDIHIHDLLHILLHTSIFTEKKKLSDPSLF